MPIDLHRYRPLALLTSHSEHSPSEARFPFVRATMLEVMAAEITAGYQKLSDRNMSELFASPGKLFPPVSGKVGRLHARLPRRSIRALVVGVPKRAGRRSGVE
jgi:hypothetical protein